MPASVNISFFNNGEIHKSTGKQADDGLYVAVDDLHMAVNDYNVEYAQAYTGLDLNIGQYLRTGEYRPEHILDYNQQLHADHQPLYANHQQLHTNHHRLAYPKDISTSYQGPTLEKNIISNTQVTPQPQKIFDPLFPYDVTLSLNEQYHAPLANQQQPSIALPTAEVDHVSLLRKHLEA